MNSVLPLVQGVALHTPWNGHFVLRSDAKDVGQALEKKIPQVMMMLIVMTLLMMTMCC